MDCGQCLDLIERAVYRGLCSRAEIVAIVEHGRGCSYCRQTIAEVLALAEARETPEQRAASQAKADAIVRDLRCDPEL